MRNTFIIIILTVLLAQTGLAQIDTLKIEHISKTTNKYDSFVILNDRLFALNSIGQLIIWDLEKLDTINFSHNDTACIRYSAIAKDRNNMVFLGTIKGDVYRVDPSDLSYSLYYHDKYRIYSICFNSENNMFLVVPYAIYEPRTKKHWEKFENHAGGIIVKRKRFMGLSWKQTDEYFTLPQFTYLDSQDRWWMCASHGEFGGDVEIFDTKNKKILSNRFEGLKTGDISPQSVFESPNKNIYITSGLQHFINSGEIYQISTDGKSTKIFDSNDFQDTTKQGGVYGNLFIGPGAYNSHESTIYFASSEGFFKTKMPENDKIEQIQFLFNPSLSWERESLAIGVSMAIKKMEFLPNHKLLFLTGNDGFGLYDGKKTIIFN